MVFSPVSGGNTDIPDSGYCNRKGWGPAPVGEERVADSGRGTGIGGFGGCVCVRGVEWEQGRSEDPSWGHVPGFISITQQANQTRARGLVEEPQAHGPTGRDLRDAQVGFPLIPFSFTLSLTHTHTHINKYIYWQLTNHS